MNEYASSLELRLKRLNPIALRAVADRCAFRTLPYLVFLDDARLLDVAIPAMRARLDALPMSPRHRLALHQADHDGRTHQRARCMPTRPPPRFRGRHPPVARPAPSP